MAAQVFGRRKRTTRRPDPQVAELKKQVAHLEHQAAAKQQHFNHEMVKAIRQVSERDRTIGELIAEIEGMKSGLAQRAEITGGQATLRAERLEAMLRVFRAVSQLESLIREPN